MKKRFLVFVPLVCLSLCALIALPIWVGKGGEQVEITQTTLEGDPAYAQGLTVSCHTMWEGHLFWETTFSAQDPSQSRTELTTYQNEHRTGGYTPQLELTPASCNFGISTSEDSNTGLLDDSWSPWNYEEFLAPVKGLAQKMEPGTTQTFSVRLNDWYDAWPLTITQYYFSLDWEGMSQEKASEQFQNFFGIPVPQDFLLYYTLKMNEKGAVYDLEVSPDPPAEEPQTGDEMVGDTATVQEAEGSVPREPFLESHSVRGEQGWYLVLDNRFAQVGQPRTDLSHVQGGNGVFLIPAQETNRGEALRLGEIRTVYPFPEGESAVSIDQDQAGRLLVYTADEAGNWYLTVLEEENAQVLQRLELGQLGGGSVLAFVEGDGIRLVQVGSEQLLLLVEEAGGYRLESILPLPEDMMYQLGDWTEGSSAAWDGARLAVICPQFGSYQTQMLAAVWQDGEVAYLGTYQNSLGRSTVLSNNSRAVQLDTTRQTFRLEWS